MVYSRGSAMNSLRRSCGTIDINSDDDSSDGVIFIGADAPKKSPTRQSQLLPQESFLIPADEMDDVLEGLHSSLAVIEEETIFSSQLHPVALQSSYYRGPEEVAAIADQLQRTSLEPQELNPLNGFLELLKEKKRLKNFNDVTRDLAVLGRNILHRIAEEPVFALYEPILKKHINSSYFGRLINQKTEEDGEYPLHTICRYQNAPMLKCILKSKRSNVKDLLKETGIMGTKAGKCNAFLCLGQSFLDKKIVTAYSTQMFDLLLELYGEEATATLVKAQDNTGCNFIGYARQANMDALATKAIELITKDFTGSKK